MVKQYVFHVSDRDLKVGDHIRFAGRSSFGEEHTKSFEKETWCNLPEEIVQALRHVITDEKKIVKLAKVYEDNGVGIKDLLVMAGETTHNYYWFKYRFLQLIEHLFEKVRQLEFPQEVSRLNCIFVSETLEDARKFYKTHRANAPEYQNAKIRLFKAKLASNARIFRGDLDGIKVKFESIDQIEERARKYWSGEPINSPAIWEILVDGNDGIEIVEELPI